MYQPLTYKNGTITPLTHRNGKQLYLYEYRDNKGMVDTIKEAKRLISHYRNKHKENQQQELTC